MDGDTLNIYAGRDEAAIGAWFLMNEWVCYSTKDMVNWKYEGSVLKATDFAWGTPATAWGCQVVKRHGRYFLYSTTGRPDLNGDGTISEGADIFSKIEIKDRPMGFWEAPWLYNANGKYYLVDAMDMPQKVAYAMSDSPRGPWQYKGAILNENRRPDGSQGAFSSDTSHPAVVEFNGQWYVFHHNSAPPTGGQTRCSVCVEKMSYNADGTIARSFITSTGPLGGAVRIQSVGQADQYVTISGFDVNVDTLPAPDRAFRPTTR